MGYISTDQNAADIATKPLPYGVDRRRKIRKLIYDIYPEGETERRKEQ